MLKVRFLAGIMVLAAASLCSGVPAAAQPWGGAPGYDRGYDQGLGRPYRQMPPMAVEMGYSDGRAYESDRQLARQAQAEALSYPQIKFVVRWVNRATGNRGETFVQGEGRDEGGRRCRDLRETVWVYGRSMVNTGLACWMGDRWRTVG